uniref:zinc transporter ZIP4-like n=1 Tax=Centroberyx gerrardi TaxID=166262 RepID=UPI003AAB8F89
MFPSVLLLCLFASLGSFGSVSGSPALEEAYKDVVGVVSPGQQNLTEESVRSLFSILEKRVQCGEVSCEKCNLTESIDQLISNHSIHGEGETEEEGGGGEVIVSISEFTAVAAGCLFYLSSPAAACTAARQGRWGEETEHFLHRITHEEHHEHHQEENGPHRDHEEADGPLHNHTHEEEHQHEHIDVHGLEALLQELEEHYKPSQHESFVTASDIMAEVNASSAGAGQREELGAVLGRVLYHALQGHCFISRPLPEESFFLDYIMERIGSENFTVSDLKALMRSLKLGLSLEHEHEHGHEEDEHTDHDHSGPRLKKRNHHEHQEGHGRNDTWEQSCFSAEELVLIHGLVNNGSVASGLDRSDLARLSPALLQQILSGACISSSEPLQPDELTQTESK